MMLVWIPLTIAALTIAGMLARAHMKRRKARLIAARRVVERPNSYYASKSVRDQEDAEWYQKIELHRLHEVNREYAERLLAKIAAAGPESLNRDERAFLERMANLEAPPRRGLRPEESPWPFPA